jgi:hypothetical protein
LISLGFLPTKKARVSATASAVALDVRTGFTYGVAEASAVDEQRASYWSSREAIDSARIEAERTAFRKLAGEIELLWSGILTTHAATARRRD